MLSTSTSKIEGIGPLMTKTNTSDRDNVSELFLSQGIDISTADILMASWRRSEGPDDS